MTTPNKSIHELGSPNQKQPNTPRRIIFNEEKTKSKVEEVAEKSTGRGIGKAFESSRMEVRMCLEDLGARVSAELAKLEGAITELTVTIETEFHRQLQ